ncbi:GCN5 family acetyltransferase [Burkholderia lata]|uniref:GCN5 family acetyltransferase n=1 Tax=Burkholderia lata (strain ATCC 17760 / DSM 23089 / LMG 22485 / NCIMB 9086 / R18194 / 383) TaxID=482957 RepID=A0A6P2YI16_BURL3|nr:GNAT family N-acetyltransferase [Burkholderia lata]VWD19416.1 GCN5 family acetyltransferase [Burkholderia lata]
MPEIHLKRAVTDEDYRSAFDVMRELRPHLTDADAFVRQMRRQAEQGYVLLTARHGSPDGAVVALAGYRHLENTLYGRFVYVDDLVATEHARNQRLGERLLDAVRDDARQHGCLQLVLDTGLSNALAQRFYFRHGLLSRGMHFSQSLQAL